MHKPEAPDWLEADLLWGLREESAPEDLWDRVQAGRVQTPVSRRRFSFRMNYAMAAAAVVLIGAAIGLPVRQDALAPGRYSASRLAGEHCQNPAEMRAWVKADPMQPAAWRETGHAASLQIGCKLCHLD
jgi:hypothetical protein